ncbi:MAG: hypothetical protein AAFY88_23580, partial [Acidobacteriota bacterium]
HGSRAAALDHFVENDVADPTPVRIDGSQLTAASASSSNSALFFELGAFDVNIRNSELHGFGTGGSAVRTLNAVLEIQGSELTGNLLLVTGDSLRIGSSQLAGGGLISATASATCAGVYDASYTFFPSTCL